ncbi:molybdate transport system permease protein [Capnocytophaga haemolytica]|jgi:molybdate ABC transporter, permease protein|uniref:Molybdenum transport system permease n=1 Tax=Capnocytophaga haemolytica TaxID=45243 RepID=A0AAX2GWT6_9FLAO|nr:molybdate ABC transporter permease subunit [Capnocytophaga haemolytica]AMD84783.1 molybdenum ABC transporter permease [Capnocytophaga haemolytica]SFN74113.1 molybdate transport system permease protein [Capnocytophaga haemolytica]SNV07489.1 Sulfate transport system permease protein CysW [Capnocytophaga haemolytica]
MDSDFLYTLLLTGKLALLTTLVLLAIGFPIAYWLNYSKIKAKILIETLIAMPMVLPPTVLGYYILVALRPESPMGHFFEQVFDKRLAFSFEGILIASIITNLPFMIQPLQSGFASLGEELREAAYTMGKSKTITLLKVLIPNIRPSIITAIALTFAHCIGEFGVVIMVGGSIPHETRIASIAIYDEVQAINFEAANRYALILFVLSFSILLLIFSVNRKFKITYR